MMLFEIIVAAALLFGMYFGAKLALAHGILVAVGGALVGAVVGKVVGLALFFAVAESIEYIRKRFRVGRSDQIGT